MMLKGRTHLKIRDPLAHELEFLHWFGVILFVIQFRRYGRSGGIDRFTLAFVEEGG